MGVISKDYQKPTVEEFFQLFKVPWEFYNQEKSYDVIIVTDNSVLALNAKLVIIFGSETTSFDNKDTIYISPHTDGILLEYGHLQFPIHKDLAIFQSSAKPFIKVKDKDEFAGIEYIYSDQRILRIGYDLFDEIEFLLTKGQPVAFAYIPTVEIHIALLRNWILEAGIAVVEIPPSPCGFDFTVCLTHDVDFIGIRDHKLDRSVLGFIFRVLFPPSLRNSQSKILWKRMFKNIKALMSLPAVYAGISRDFWFDIDRYMEMEKDMHSTFFFIPFKNNPGITDNAGNRPPLYRAARYSIEDHKTLIETIVNNGHEIGIHGIDAWYSTERGLQEIQVLRKMTGADAIGVRMHWLYFSDNSPKILKDAGFIYDSTLGYNEAVGYLSGTTQVFNLAGSSGLLEVPLHVMDTALFYPKRMGVSEEEALLMCKKFIDDTKTYGGVLVINWHSRSLSPERNWDDFYIELLRLIKAENVWFASARQAVEWFRKRRAVQFEYVTFLHDKVQIKLNGIANNIPPDITIRVCLPEDRLHGITDSAELHAYCVNIPWSGEACIEHTLPYSNAGVTIRA